MFLFHVFYKGKGGGEIIKLFVFLPLNVPFQLMLSLWQGIKFY